ncbi:PREDICTED: exocyst complex component 4-like [Amphimedon queenslandica]|uniref:Exocyst complex component Sec8 n=1 Tax=Amphimedon queenslandica TaxID=400682 RepID=A0AAN0IER5_AMPQE|nr:PREDICTED: exocyst complex component 4-like [Amphimedon queenslandica]|eukprot:XP_003386577.1 PREDICTED: exocyst complex component 4-like [Amphimedon queenslandica]
MAYYSSFPSSFPSTYNTGGSGGKSQGSLLQVVIRKLAESYDDDERRQHYEEIQADLDVAEENLHSLVDEHQDKLHSTLATFQKIDVTVKESQFKVHQVRENLALSRVQLQCKREALKRLYFDNVKHKIMLKLLNQVDDMKHVPEKLQSYRLEKKYYEATELLKNAVSLLEKDLSNIEALRELRVELKHLKDSFHEELIDELQHQLYVKATGFAYQSAINQFSHSIQQQHSRTSSDVSSRSSPLPIPRSSTKHSRHSSKTITEPTSILLTPPPVIETSINEEVEASMEHQSALVEYISSLVESLSMLGKVPEMLDAIQKKMLQELVLIIEKASIRIAQLVKDEGVSLEMAPSSKCTNPKYLETLLEMCFQQFDDVVAAHSLLLKCLTKIKATYKGTYELYSEIDVWTAIQHVLRDLLEIYLAVDEEKPHTAMSAFTPFAIAGHEFVIFKKKVATKTRKQPLFRFDNSRHALSVSSYIKEQRDKELAAQVQSGQVAQLEHNFEDNQPSISQHIVCKPSARNITVMYSPVRDFVLKIEEAMQLQPDTHCDLYQFLQDFVENRFLDTIQIEFQEKMDNALKPEARDSIKVLRNSNKPALLASSVILWDSLKELYQLMLDIPMYSANFLSIAYNLLQTYVEITLNMFNDCVSASPGAAAANVPGPSLVAAAVWVGDRERLKSLVNFSSWELLMTKKHKRVDTSSGKNSIYNEESQLLLSSRKNYERSEMIFEHDSIKLLCVLNESMEWLGVKLEEMIKDMSGKWKEEIDGSMMSRLKKHFSVHEQQAVVDNDVQTRESIESLSHCLREIKEISRAAIMVLHLEIRFHCFYFLMPTLTQSTYVCEHEVADCDSGVKELANDLTSLKMNTVGILTLPKQSYLFDGVGHLVAAIFINSTSFLNKININGVKKMCRNIQHIQSCLSKITSVREKDLDLAQKYFAMLYVNEEEFLKLVMEQGRVFNQVDYVSALTLLYNSQGHTNPVRLDNNIKKLEQMFDDDAC